MTIKLRPFQEKILADLRGIPAIAIFSSTGSGKTFMSLFRVKENGTKNILVICPSKAVSQWKREVVKIFPNIYVPEVKKSWNSTKIQEKYIKDGKKANGVCWVISVESARLFTDLHKHIDESFTIILDESHRIKDYGTDRKIKPGVKAVLEFGAQTPFKIILTATPTQKAFGGYADYYSQLKFLSYLDMSNREFLDRYAKEKNVPIPGKPYPGKMIVGYTQKVDEIEAILQMVSRRYTPKFTDAEPEDIKIAIEQPKNYKNTLKERAYKDCSTDNPMSFANILRTMCTGTVLGLDEFKERLYYEDNTNKIDWLKEFIQDNDDEKLVIFYQFDVERESLVDMAKKLKKKYIVLDGKNKDKTGDIMNKDYDLVFGQIKASGESVDGLQYKSRICIYFALPYSSLDFVQSKGRINRDGQAQENQLLYYYLVSEDTIEDKIYDLLEKKIEFSEEILNKLLIEEE